MSIESEYILIMTIVNHGYSDYVMSAAKKAGATGGTIIHAQGKVADEAVKFFGITIQDEKEVILIVCKSELKKAIMQSICNEAGIHTKAGGMSIALPVNDVVGL